MEDKEKLVDLGLMKVKDAAGFLGLSRSSIYAKMDTGELSFVKIGRARRVPRRAVVEFAARRLTGGWSTDAG
jgi:excisionase family DNA binding protein